MAFNNLDLQHSTLEHNLPTIRFPFYYPEALNQMKIVWKIAHLYVIAVSKFLNHSFLSPLNQ